ncbi:hypothetical protein [Erythrobacter sp. Alg231-14]|uniref:hypothetical protein n=1 Tax=Erythrobacter sp. Alg231-14 TaxID=1922225 RepID=UPI000D54C0D4
MQTRSHGTVFDETTAQEAELQRAARLLPGPFSVQEQAFIAATIAGPTAKSKVNKARLFFGTAAVAVAVTVPDLSAGAMDSPYLRLELSEPSRILGQPIWSPSVAATAPVYNSTMAAELIAPTSLTFGNAARFEEPTQKIALDLLENGPDRFDLAFAEVAMPSPIQFTIAGPLPPQGRAEVQSVGAQLAAPLRASLIDIPQITDVSNFAPAPAPDVRRAGSELSAGSSIERSVAIANESVAAAFAGTLDVSGDMGGTIPIETGGAVRIETAQIAGAVPVPAEPSGLSASRAAETELVTRTRLDARVNGVITGSVEFQQRDGTIAIRLGSVVDMLRDRYSASELDRFSQAGAKSAFITLDELQAAGIPITYDPVYDEVGFGIDYDDAPDAGKVQVEQIGSPSVGSDRALIDQIPR